MSKQNGRTPQPLPPHVNLKTTRMQEMIDWYGTVVGAKPNFHFPAGAWLTNNGANHRIALITSSKMSDDPRKLEHTGIHHMAFEYTSCDELLDNYVRLKALGIVPHMSLDHGMTMSFYYVDPDGNSVELQYDNFGAWNSSKEFMLHAPEFSANPIGASVEPALMAAARDAGASAEEIHRRAY